MKTYKLYCLVFCALVSPRIIANDHLSLHYKSYLIDVTGDRGKELINCTYLPYESSSDWAGINCNLILEDDQYRPLQKVAIELPYISEVLCVESKPPLLVIRAFHRMMELESFFVWQNQFRTEKKWRQASEHELNTYHANFNDLSSQCHDV